MALTWPPILIPSRVSWRMENASRSGGASITGAEQVIASDAGRWRSSFTFPVVREEWIVSLRGFIAALDGRAGEVEVPVFDYYTAKDINGRRLSPREGAALNDRGDGPLFFDNSAFGQLSETLVTVAANAALRATRITVTAEAPWMVPRPGQYFGIGTRLYMAVRVYRATEESPWTVDFRPPLRAAVTAGEKVITDRPVCTMRLASDDGGALDLDLGRFGSTTLEFVEAV